MSSDEQSNKHILDPKGDVTLIVGTESKALEITVSSKVLELASSVFTALLGPFFKEGTELTVSGSVRISLPDDNPQGALCCLKMLHFISQRVSSIRIETCLGVATFCDKYGIREIFDDWAIRFLPATFPSRDEDKAAKLIGIVYHFGMKTKFYEYTKLYLYGHKYSWLQANLRRGEKLSRPDLLDDGTLQIYSKLRV